MNFALDSSFALAWVLQDEATPRADQALQLLGQGAKAFIPALWRWEVANALWNVARRKRATASAVNEHLLLLQSLPIEVDAASLELAWTATSLLARRHKLSIYDAAYLELALRRGLPLASFDSELASAAKVEGVALL